MINGLCFRIWLFGAVSQGTEGKPKMNASDIMTKTVVTGTPGTTVKKAAELMSQHRISAIPVLDDADGLVGIVSEGDLMRRVEGARDEPRSWWLSFFTASETNAKNFVKEHGQLLRDIMTTQLTTVRPDTPVGQIALLLKKNTSSGCLSSKTVNLSES